jgi:prepilin-type processing-associated H-X9-DG protein
MTEPRPHYEPPKPCFQLKVKLTEILVCLVILGILYAILYPLFLAASINPGRKLSCLSNGKQLSLAVMMYSQDYDEHLPLAANWYDASYPYYRNKALVCPERPNKQGVGYAMDERLSGRSLNKVGQDHSARPLLYESANVTPNAHDAGTSFAGRHTNQTGWVGFVDGHVKMFQKATYPQCK